MDIAAMNERIVFQKNMVVSDSIGNHKNIWEDYYSCYATISDSMGKSNVEDAVAGLLVDTSDVGFTVRYCRKTGSVTSTGFRILWNGEIYNIVKVDHLNMKKHALKFKCEKERS